MAMTMSVLDIADFVTKCNDMKKEDFIKEVQKLEIEDAENINNFLELTNLIERESYMAGARHFKDQIKKKFEV